jgi:hypothetical protein
MECSLPSAKAHRFCSNFTFVLLGGHRMSQKNYLPAAKVNQPPKATFARIFSARSGAFAHLSAEGAGRGCNGAEVAGLDGSGLR